MMGFARIKVLSFFSDKYSLVQIIYDGSNFVTISQQSYYYSNKVCPTDVLQQFVLATELTTKACYSLVIPSCGDQSKS